MEFCREEKNKVYIVTAVDRQTHTIVGWTVCAERTLEILQAVIDSAPKAEDYYTDGFLMYQDLSYSGNDLRRTFAKLAHKGDSPIDQIQLSLGHDSIKATEKYLGVEQDLTDASCDHLGIKILN